MLIDFCHHSVRPQIKCDKVSFDGYEVTNLISDNNTCRNKGFISDHFIKPPVNITLQFPCNISIYRIVIDPVISQQQSCDLKLFTASLPGLDSWLSGQCSSTEQREFKVDGILFNFIGSSSQTTPTVTCYQNNLLRDRGCWNRERIQHANSYSACFELRGKKPSCLFNVSHLSINIFRTKGGKAVAIKRIEVWGMPSRNVPDKCQHVLRLAYQESERVITYTEGDEIAQAKAEHSSREDDNVCKTESHSLIQGDVQVPDDFLDQLTFELMVLPMLLPCGKNVDQTTLERFVDIEASWGRHPSDPFTGVPLGQGNNAVSNAALKARIDQFVIQHSQKLNVPRTIGKGQQKNPDTLRSSSIVTSANRSLVQDTNPKPKPSSHQALYKQHCISLEGNVGNPGKRKSGQQQFTEDNVFKKLCYKSQGSHVVNDGKQGTKVYYDWKNMSQSFGSQVTENVHCNTTQKKVKTSEMSEMDHSKSLSNSLECALLSTLTSLPSYTKRSKQINAENIEKSSQESRCSCNVNSETVVYRLPCKHIICRACLTGPTGPVVCGRCFETFNSKDVVRVFV